MIALALNLALIGSVIAFPVSAAMALTRGAAPRLRYAAALVAFAAAAIVPLAMTFRAAPAAPSFPALQTGLEEISMIWEAGIVRRLAVLLWTAIAIALVAREVAGHVSLARSGASGPATIGLLRPRMILPAWLERLPSDTAARIVRHEQAHVRWRDPLAIALVRLVRALLWPSFPLWYLERMIRTEQEVAADAEALAAEPEAAAEYAGSLIDAARVARRETAAAAFGGVQALQERIERLLASDPPGRTRSVAAASVIAAGALAVAVAPITPRVRAMPLRAVGHPALDALIAATRYHDHTASKDVRRQLASLRGSGEISPLAAALRHRDRRVRESAAWIAGELGDARAIPLLVECLDDPDPHIRLSASIALRRWR